MTKRRPAELIFGRKLGKTLDLVKATERKEVKIGRREDGTRMNIVNYRVR